MDDSTLARVEQQLSDLAENIAKLRKSLRHWQTLEIDYEGLREEFQGLAEDSSYEECLHTAKDFKPELVDAKELEDLFEDKRGGHKNPSSLVEILTKRIEYVVRNVSSIRKQLSDAETKRNALLLAQDPEHQDDAGLPLGEIVEELDEEGNVISSRVQTPGKDASDLLEVLRKAGVPDVKDGSNDSTLEDTVKGKETDTISTTLDSKPDTAIPVSTATLTDSNRVEELSDDESVSDPGELGPKNPDDTEEDAVLRQEMLQYGLGEVGAIVAELELEDSNNFSYDEDEGDEDLSDYDEDEDLYTDESEDERGATKNPVISDRYKRQMEALSKKHGITDLKNLGPDPILADGESEQLDRPSAAEAARKAAIAREEANRSTSDLTGTEDKLADEPKKKKKRVAFATELDIAKETAKSEVLIKEEPAVNPIGESVIERNTDNSIEAAAPPSTQPPQAKKVSRFKAARSAAPQTPMFPPAMDFPSISKEKPTPEGPPGRTISDTLVERPASSTTTPVDPTDFDEELHRREVATEFQKMRNRKIHEQGGYVKGGEQDNYGEEAAPMTVVDENTGKPRKISRFKAARMKQ